MHEPLRCNDKLSSYHVYDAYIGIQVDLFISVRYQTVKQITSREGTMLLYIVHTNTNANFHKICHHTKIVSILQPFLVVMGAHNLLRQQGEVGTEKKLGGAVRKTKLSMGRGQEIQFVPSCSDGGAGRVPVGSKIFTSPYRPDRLWGPPNLL
jgi:hypothetical protein